MYNSIHNPVIGIDLGTTYSAISRWEGTKAEVYCPKGEYMIPSAIYDNGDNFLVGKVAKDKGILFPQNLCIGVKRDMDDKEKLLNLGTNQYSAIDLSAEILKQIYSNVASMFPNNSYKAEGAVITVPYYFRANQISNTEEAARKAGLNVIGILQEPIAAALTYGLYLSNKAIESENILVFDLGGGTFDVTVFNLSISETKIIFNTIATNGDDRMGGLDFDNEIYNYILKREKIDFSTFSEKMQLVCKNKLMDQVVAAKERLSFDTEVYIQVVDVPPGEFLECSITRDELKQCLHVYLNKIKKILVETLEASELNIEDIQKVIKIGGSSKMPIIDEIIEAVLGDGKIYGDIDPDLAVSKGAAIYAAFLNKRIEINKSIEVKLINAHPLGVKDDFNEFVEIIPKNVLLPFEQTLVFTNTKDNETEMTIEVYQGTNVNCDMNKNVGNIVVKGLKPSPKESLDIEITFRINTDQTIDVTVIQAESNIKVSERF